MIKVTLGEKPKEEKPFPKLMTNSNGAIRLVFEDLSSVLIVSVCGHSVPVFHEKDRWNHLHFHDYNEPITLQNL